jgi:acyl carrier protein
MQTNQEILQDILKKYTTTEFNGSSTLKEDLKLDSLNLVELIMECEEKFGFEIPEERLHAVSTVEDIQNLITSLVSSN